MEDRNTGQRDKSAVTYAQHHTVRIPEGSISRSAANVAFDTHLLASLSW